QLEPTRNPVIGLTGTPSPGRESELTCLRKVTIPPVEEKHHHAALRRGHEEIQVPITIQAQALACGGSARDWNQVRLWKRGITVVAQKNQGVLLVIGPGNEVLVSISTQVSCHNKLGVHPRIDEPRLGEGPVLVLNQDGNVPRPVVRGRYVKVPVAIQVRSRQ